MLEDSCVWRNCWLLFVSRYITTTDGDIVRTKAANEVFVFVSAVIGDKGKDIPADIALSLTATGFLVKGIEYFMSSQLGKWISKNLDVAEGGVAGMLRSFTKWFTADGVTEGSWAVKILGKDSAEFLAKRLGPALCVFAIVLCSLDLAKAAESGDIRDIVFESLNLTVAVSSLIFLGLELFEFAWAGPVGMAVAIIGLLIAFVQLLWNIFDPPKPPQDPVEKFVNGPLKNAGYTK